MVKVLPARPAATLSCVPGIPWRMGSLPELKAGGGVPPAGRATVGSPGRGGTRKPTSLVRGRCSSESSMARHTHARLPVFLGCFFLLIISYPPELRKISLQVYVKKVLNFLKQKAPFRTNFYFRANLQPILIPENR